MTAELECGQLEETIGDAYTSLAKSLDIYTETHSDHGVEEVNTPLGHLLVTLGQIEAAAEKFEPASTGEDAEGGGHHGGGHHGGGSPEVLFGRARLAQIAGDEEQAAEAYERANYEANVSGRKEVAVESRIALGRLYLRQGKLPNAARLLDRTQREAAEALLRPLQSEAASLLSEVHLKRGDAEPARKAALESIELASKFSGRPVLVQAYVALGDAELKLNRKTEALNAYKKAAAELEWIRQSLLPQHVDSFMRTAEIQTIVSRIASALETGGENDEAAALKKWLVSEPTAS